MYVSKKKKGQKKVLSLIKNKVLINLFELTLDVAISLYVHHIGI